LNVLVNAKENEFDPKKIVAKLKKIQRLNKEDKLKHHCEVLSEQVKKCNNVLPLAQKIRAMNIDIGELLAFVEEVHSAIDTGPVWLSQLISHPSFCLYTKIAQCYAVKHYSLFVYTFSRQLM
jgi:hypothetical protein